MKIVKVEDKSVTIAPTPGGTVAVIGRDVKRLPYDHIKVGQMTASKLSGDKELSGVDHRVLWAVLSVVQMGNSVMCTQQEMSEISGVARPNVSKSLKKLVEKGYLIKMKSIGSLNTYMLAPEHVYRGDNKDYYKTKGRIVKHEIAQNSEDYQVG